MNTAVNLGNSLGWLVNMTETQVCSSVSSESNLGWLDCKMDLLVNKTDWLENMKGWWVNNLDWASRMDWLGCNLVMLDCNLAMLDCSLDLLVNMMG